ncbi:MAG: repressor LexA [Verrucomicrobiales bacterium]|nr:repressor LexA [Verrucomicrobiales bacterium]|tara:strand:+ start:824 stop:1438 length:615 start_codon:yes stop_codon:yes gene_type:complete
MSGRSKPGETRKQVYRYVREQLEAGQPPSVREVQKSFGFKAFQTAHEHLEKLVAEGRLAKRSGARGYCLPETPVPVIRIPILGRVQAGVLSTAIEDLEGYIPVHAPPASQDLFGLKVRGDSMINAGILENDIVIVRSQSTADPGDIVVALVEDEATVKRLRIRWKRLELHAENPDYAPIIPAPGQCTILGKVVEVRRFMEGKGY